MSFSFLVSLAYSGTAVICRGRVSNDHCTQRFGLAFSRCSIHIIVGAIILCSLCIAGVTATEKEPCSETWFATNLVQARQFLAATSLPDQGLAMFAGGGQGDGPLSSVVDIFDASSGLIGSTAFLSVARGYLAAISLPNQGLAMFAGGGEAGDYSSIVDIYNSRSRSWIAASLSQPRQFLTAASLPDQGLALFAGGETAGRLTSKVVDIYNANSGRWSAASLSEARKHVAATSLPSQGLALFAGGLTGLGASIVVDIFKASSESWETASLSEARSNIAATSLPNQGLAIFAGGGQGGTGGGWVSNIVDIFNAGTGLWSTASLKVNRSYLAATSLQNQGLAIFAGGQIVGGISSNAVDIFDARSGVWSTASLIEARSQLAGTSLPHQGLAMFAGGHIGSTRYSNSVDIFSWCPLGCYIINSARVPCPAGMFNDAYGATTCRACKSGSYNPGGQPALTCSLCQAGTFNPSNGSSACSPCAAGSFSSTGQTACTLCAAGSYSKSGTSACASCAPGGYSSIGQTACTSCTPGYYSSLAGSSACTPCDAGSYNPSLGSTTPSACTPCDRGFLCTQKGLSQQVLCPSGNYCPGSEQVFPCPAGTYSPATGQTSESTCRPCSSSQSCPAGSSNPTSAEAAQSSSTMQIVTGVLSAIGSIVGIVVGIFRVYPFLKSRIAKLSEEGIKPTLCRVIFLKRTLSKHRQQLVQVASSGEERVADGAPAVQNNAAALMNLSAKQIGHLVADIAPAYTEYSRLIIDNNFSGKHIAGKSKSELVSSLKDIGIVKELHISCIVDVLVLLQTGGEAVVIDETLL